MKNDNLLLRQLRALRDAYRDGRISADKFAHHVQRCQLKAVVKMLGVTLI